MITLQQPGEMNPARLKMVLVGEPGVGKTSLIHRIADDRYYNEQPITNVAASFASHLLQIQGEPVKLEIWDTAGQERYSSLTPSFYRGSKIIGIVYDVSNRYTLQRVAFWIEDIKKQQQTSQVFPHIILIGNKTDLVHQEVSLAEAQALSEAGDGWPVYHLSAKSGDRITSCVREAAERAYELLVESGEEDSSSVIISENAPSSYSYTSCC